MAAPLVEASNVVVHFAAETHVDRSILAAGDFIQTDVEGTWVLLEAARRNAQPAPLRADFDRRGLRQRGRGIEPETDELRPRNPYSASKAGADRLAYSYWATYDVPVIITRASNNYGPYQFPEKLIPLFVTNLIDDIQVPLYGDGGNVRDWLHVLDHCRAIDKLIDEGQSGEVYNIGGGNEVKNVDITYSLLKLVGKDDSLIRRVEDRKGHDRRYSVGTNKLRNMGWAPQVDFEQGLRETVDWYQKNDWWWRPVKERDPSTRPTSSSSTASASRTDLSRQCRGRPPWPSEPTSSALTPSEQTAREQQRDRETGDRPRTGDRSRRLRRLPSR